MLQSCSAKTTEGGGLWCSMTRLEGRCYVPDCYSHIDGALFCAPQLQAFSEYGACWYCYLGNGVMGTWAAALRYLFEAWHGDRLHTHMSYVVLAYSFGDNVPCAMVARCELWS